MNIKELLASLKNEAGLSSSFMIASSHTFNCRCEFCKRWWLDMPPDYDETTDDWTFGPFTKEEMIAAGKKIPNQRPSEYFKEIFGEDSSDQP